jgi:hypothetical protein
MRLDITRPGHQRNTDIRKKLNVSNNKLSAQLTATLIGLDNEGK